MTQAEKLEALIAKANWPVLGNPDDIQFDDAVDGECTSWDGMVVYAGPSLWVNHHKWMWQQVIFNHDFARALFGDGEGGDYYKLNDPKRTKRKLWEHMLQQAVISKDPIDYMYKEVFGE